MPNTADNGRLLSEVFEAVASGHITRTVTLAGTTLAYTTLGGDTYAVTVPKNGTVHVSNRYPANGMHEPLQAWATAPEEWGVRDAVAAHIA